MVDSNGMIKYRIEFKINKKNIVRILMYESIKSLCGTILLS